MDLVGGFAREKLRVSQHSQEQECNRNTSLWVYQLGDGVLLLLPLQNANCWERGKGLLRSCGVSYKFQLVGKHRGSQIYHIKPLKSRRAQNECLAHIPTAEAKLGPQGSETGSFTEMPLGENLSLAHQEEARELVKHFTNVLTTKPGWTHLIEHLYI